jgi:hypothetical protein
MQLKKDNDYHFFLQIKDREGVVQPLANFADYQVVLKDRAGEVIRTLITTNTVADGKLLEYDTETLEYYIETRDTDANDVIRVYLKTRAANSNTFDGNFDKEVFVEEYVFSKIE